MLLFSDLRKNQFIHPTSTHTHTHTHTHNVLTVFTLRKVRRIFGNTNQIMVHLNVSLLYLPVKQKKGVRGWGTRAAAVPQPSLYLWGLWGPGWLPDQPQEQASGQGAGNGSSHAEPNLFLGPGVGTAPVLPEA